MQRKYQSPCLLPKIQEEIESPFEQEASFMQSYTFIQENILYNSSTETPKFVSEIDIALLGQSKVMDGNVCISQFLADLQKIGVDIEQVSEHEIQNSNESQNYIQYNSYLEQQRKFTQCTQNDSTSLYLTNSFPLNNVRINCLHLKESILKLPKQIKELMNQLRTVSEEMNQRVIAEAAQFISKTLARKDQEIQEILKREESLKIEKKMLQRELADLAHEYQHLKDENLSLLKVKEENQDLLATKKHFQLLQYSSQEQGELIKDLSIKISELQYQLSNSKKHCLEILEEYEESKFNLEKKYERVFEQTKVKLTRQIEVEMYYKVKYGYILELETAENMKELLEIMQNRQLRPNETDQDGNQ